MAQSINGSGYQGWRGQGGLVVWHATIGVRKSLNIRGSRRHTNVFITALLQAKSSVFNADNRWKLVSQLQGTFNQRVDTRKPLSWGDANEEDGSGAGGNGADGFWDAERERSCRFAATGQAN